MDDTKKLSDEVAEVFDEFVQFYKQSSAEIDKELDSNSRKYVFKGLVPCLIIGIAFVLFGKYLPIDYLNSNPNLVVYMYLFIILGFIILFVSLATSLRFQYKMMGDFIKDVPLDFLMAYPDVGKKEIEFLQRLSGYSKQALHYAKARYQQGCLDGDHIVALLVGGLLKIGIFPALLGLFVAAYKASQGSDIYGYAAFTVVGVYLICFKVSSAALRLKRYAFLLDFYLEHMREEKT